VSDVVTEGATGAGPGPGPGFYGKLPGLGDFVSRRLPRAFIDPWDRWLQDAIAESRACLGEDWLEAYLTGPVWRFVLDGGLCGEAVVAGVLIPSVDRVGRYFPLAAAAPLPDCRNPLMLPLLASAWFDSLEDKALAALDDGFDLDRFDADIDGVGLPDVTQAPAGPADGVVAAGTGDPGWRVAIGSEGEPLTGYVALLGRLLAVEAPQRSLWWTAGSERVDGTLVVCRGLPEPSAFAALLDGGWAQWGGDAPAPLPPPLPDDS